jgi:hypothetical protein
MALAEAGMQVEFGRGPAAAMAWFTGQAESPALRVAAE